MKNFRKIFILILMAGASFNVSSQTVNCNLLCVTDIQMDSVGNFDVTIFNGDTVFINYPYVDSVLATNGDLIGDGDLSFFGQLANTSQTYSVTSYLGAMPLNLHCTVYFKYSYPDSICVLPYPCTNNMGINDLHSNDVNIYPNPAVNKIMVDLKGLDLHYPEIKLINALGQIMVSKNIVYTEDHIELNTDNLENGIYFIFVQTNNQRLSQKIIIQK